MINGSLVTETNSSVIEIANNVFIGADTLIDCVVKINIEDDVLISHGCILMDSNNHSIKYSSRVNDLKDWRNGGIHDWSSTDSKAN